MLRRALWLAITFVVMLNLSVSAANIDKLSKDTKMQAALSILEQTGSKNLIDNLAKENIQIRFYDLSMISYEYARHYQ